MLSHTEQPDILTRKQVHRQHRRIVNLRPVISHGIQREARREGQLGIVPRFDQRQLLLIDSHLQVLEVQTGDGKAERRQIGHRTGKVKRHLPPTAIHSHHRPHPDIDGARLKQRNERIFGRQHKRRIGIDRLFRNASHQLRLDDSRCWDSVANLIRSQQACKLVKHFFLQALHLTLGLVGTIGLRHHQQ